MGSRESANFADLAPYPSWPRLPWLGVAFPFRVSFRVPFFAAFCQILRPSFVTFCSCFRSWARLGGSRIFEGRPKRNRSFRGARRPRTAPKGSPEGDLKMDQKKTRKNQFLGVRFRSLGSLLGDSWAYLGALSCCLATSWSQGPKKGGPREPKSSPKVPRSLKRALQNPQKEAKPCQKQPKTSTRLQQGSRICIHYMLRR
jgi:hypothetical protein